MDICCGAIPPTGSNISNIVMSTIKLNEVYKPKKSYKVIVKTITFNQSKYIEDTLNGIAMQNTYFPFVNVVLEDNSTDGEQDVIRMWLNRECDMSLAEYYDIPTANVVIVPHRTNQNSTFAIYFHKENLFSKKEKREAQVNPWRENSEYEALCEGDDYWIDSLKLQKQIDYLDLHEDVGMCYTAVMQYDQEKNKIVCDRWGGPYQEFSELMINNTVPTLSVVYRTILEKEYLEHILPHSNGWPLGDYPRWLYFSKNSRVVFVNEVTGVYRILRSSAYHGNYNHRIKFSNGANDMLLYFAQLYDYDLQTIIDRKYRSLFTLAVRYGKLNDVPLYFNKIKNKTIKDYLKRYFYFLLRKISE